VASALTVHPAVFYFLAFLNYS